MTIFDRAELAYFLAVEMDSAVSHLDMAIMCVLLAEFERAHWEFWRGGFTKVRPAENADFEAVSEPQAQPTLFGAQGER